MREPGKLFSGEDRTWLYEINQRKKLIVRAYELKGKISTEIWKDALRIYEAQDKYLNQLTIADLMNLVKDLERIGEQ